MPTPNKESRCRPKDRLMQAGLALSRRLTWLTQLAAGKTLARIRRRRELAKFIRASDPIRFCQLEPRRVLNASFDLVGANLQLNNFANGTNLDVTHNNLTNSYQFTLSNGTWFDNLGSNTGSNVLSVLDSVLTGTLRVDSTVATDVLLSGNLGVLNQVLIESLGQVSDSNGTQLQTSGLLSIKSASVTLGEQPTDLYQVNQLSLDIAGTAEFHAVGNLDVLLANSTGNMTLFAGSLQLDSANSQSNFEAQATTGDILIGSVSATGDIRLTSDQASILDAQDDSVVDLSAGGTINLSAAQHILSFGATDPFLEVAAGSKVTAQSTVDGNIQLVGLGTLELKQISTVDGNVTIGSVGSMTAVDVDVSATDSVANFVNLTTTGLNSDLNIQRIAAGMNNGLVSLIAVRNIVDGDNLVDDLDVVAGTTTLHAQTGWVGSQAGTNTSIFTETYQSDMSLEVQWQNDLRATAGVSVVLNPDNGAGSMRLNAPTAVLVSNGNINMANVDYSSVNNLALVADADKDTVGAVNLVGTVTVNGDLRIQGDDVISPGALNFQASRMLLQSNQAEQFSMNHVNPNSAVDLDGRTVGNMTITTQGSLRLIDLDSSGSSLHSTSGSVLVSSSTGNITILSSVQASRDILLHAGEDLVVSASLVTTSGHISLLADDDVTLNSQVTTTAGGTVCVEADNKNADAVLGIVMSNSSSIVTSNSDVRMVSANEGNIFVQSINVGSGKVSLIAEGSLLATSSNHLIVANELRLEADAQVINASNGLGSIGLPSPNNGTANNNDQAVHTQVAVLAAVSASGLYLINEGSLRIDTVGPVIVQCVNMDGRQNPKNGCYPCRSHIDRNG